MHIEKEKVNLTLLADDMNLYTEDSKQFTKKIVIIHEFKKQD
jgi:hypothetical protein